MLDLVLDELLDNGVLGGKGFLNRPVILVHLVGCDLWNWTIRYPNARYGARAGLQLRQACDDV